MLIRIYYRWLLLQIVLINTCFVVITARGRGGFRIGGRRGGGFRLGGGSRSSSSSHGSKPSPSYSLPSPSYSRPSPSISRPSPSHYRPSHSYSYGGHSPYSRPSYSSSSGSDYESKYMPSPYNRQDNKEPFRPFPTSVPNMHPMMIPRLTGPLSPGDPYRPTIYIPKPPGDCPPFSMINLECPSWYEELNRRDSKFDSAVSNNKPEKASTSTYKFTERSEPQSGYPSSLNRPCPPDYESSKKRAVPEKSSIYTSRSEPQAQNNKKFQVQIKNIRPYSCNGIRYLEHYLGGYTWQPNCGIPTPAYMNYVGIPTGANMNGFPLKRKGFIGSVMSSNNSEQIYQQQTRYHGSYPTPYGIKYLKKWGKKYVNEHFLGKHSSSAALYTIFPFMTPKNTEKSRKLSFYSVPMYMPPRLFHQHRYLYTIEDGQVINTEYAEYFKVFGDDYVGKCQQPLKEELNEIKCEATLDEIKCNATCISEYHFPQNGEFLMNRCWHVTGVWRPQKNFPVCKPLCDEPCQNGGQCIKPEKCRCTPGFRGNHCEFHFLKCDVRSLTSEERSISWACHHFTNGTVCKVKCKEPAEFEYPSAAEYKCTPDGSWTPDVLPRCIVKEDR